MDILKLKSQSIFLFSTFFLVLTLLFSSCSDQTLPKYNVLDRIRILALVANKPEANPGELVQITPIVSDVTETSALSFEAYGCLDHGVALGAEPSCANSSSKISLSSGSINVITSARAFTGEANSFSLTLPSSSEILSQRSPAQKYNGVAYIIEYILKNSRGEQVNAIKRIAVTDTTKTNKNSNPVINEIYFNGTTASSLPTGQTVTASISFTGSPTESYQKMQASGEFMSLNEEAVTTWFVTDGKMSFQRTIGLDTNEFQVEGPSPSGRPAFLIAVTRDGRGGVHHIIKCFGACP
jgi:hypothetical protein